MPNPKLPIELLEARGKKHLTKSEIEERKQSELKVDLKKIKTPSYLNDDQKKEFKSIAKKLLLIGVMTELDEDCLARYLISKDQYIKYTKEIDRELANEEVNMIAIDKMTLYQDRAFKQCRMCANDLGLTITSRARLVVPSPPEQIKKNKFEKFKQ